jgi:hypothetical protein
LTLLSCQQEEVSLRGTDISSNLQLFIIDPEYAAGVGLQNIGLLIQKDMPKKISSADF